MKLFAFILLSVLPVIGCDKPFTPMGPYEERLVVFGILTNTSDTQYVRVFKTYNPPGVNPLENVIDQAIRGAEVSVTQGSSSMRYQEIAVSRIDTSRYSGNIVAYAAYPFRIQPGRIYDLSVTSQQLGRIGSTVTVPERGRLHVMNSYVLKGLGAEDEDLVVLAYIRYATRGLMIRFYLDYEVPVDNTWIRQRTEMPNQVRVFDDTVKLFGFPKLERRVSTASHPAKEELEKSDFSKIAYFERLNDLQARYSRNLRVIGALFVLTQVEQSLYTYYNLANGFQDSYSIRTDLPDWSNIKGGYGVFGAMVEDSAYVNLD